jgi:hypothetical protein
MIFKDQGWRGGARGACLDYGSLDVWTKNVRLMNIGALGVKGSAPEWGGHFQNKEPRKEASIKFM